MIQQPLYRPTQASVYDRFIVAIMAMTLNCRA